MYIYVLREVDPPMELVEDDDAVADEEQDAPYPRQPRRKQAWSGDC